MKMTIYLPDDLAEQVKHNLNLNASAVCQAAFRRELARAAGEDRGIITLERPEFTGPMVRGPHGEEAVTLVPQPQRPGDADCGVLMDATPMRLTGDEPLRLAVALFDAWTEARHPQPAGDREQVTVSREDLTRVLDFLIWVPGSVLNDCLEQVHRLRAAAGAS